MDHGLTPLYLFKVESMKLQPVNFFEIHMVCASVKSLERRAVIYSNRRVIYSLVLYIQFQKEKHRRMVSCFEVQTYLLQNSGFEAFLMFCSLSRFILLIFSFKSPSAFAGGSKQCEYIQQVLFAWIEKTRRKWSLKLYPCATFSKQIAVYISGSEGKVYKNL